MPVMIVESPTKAKTIKKYLGADYQILASFGHIRDLPSKNGAVEPESEFKMNWSMEAASKKRINDISQALKSDDDLILATDPDREGEAISWHVIEVLKNKKALKNKNISRVVFNSVTKSSIQDALKEPREIDKNLVEAYLARRALDYLFGFNLSPVLWRKLPGSRSAGRVQSVALRIVSDREDEIERFISEEYWQLFTNLSTQQNNNFKSKLVAVNGKKLKKLDIGNGEYANSLKSNLDNCTFKVDNIVKKPIKRSPYPPFTTSTLQQEASNKLKFSPKQTMIAAQRLYEGININGNTQGLITYMRTDAVFMTPQSINDCRNQISVLYGDKYLPKSPRFYKTKSKNAQEAHEAIRPTELSINPKEASKYLEKSEVRLYELIWKRTIASQMENALFERTTVEIDGSNDKGENYQLRSSGQVLVSDGFMKVYGVSTNSYSGNNGEEGDALLPQMNKGEILKLLDVEATQHFTEPPPRFTEASLIKKMEELGIGRPSTYASTMSVLQDRNYVRIEKRKLIPEDRGRLVVAFLEHFFNRYVEFDFTANLEEQLDLISDGKMKRKEFLDQFWKRFSSNISEIKDLRVTEVLDALNEMLGPHIFPKVEGVDDPRACTKCDDGQLSLKVGKFGAFVGCSNYPDCNYTRPFGAGNDGQGDADAKNEDQVLGTEPDSGLEIFVKSGRFGPYLQLGEAKKGEKPKRVSIPKNYSPDQVDLELALNLINLPREVGKHPETDKIISSGIGRYGPFLLHNGAYSKLPSIEDVFTIGLNRAVSIIADNKSTNKASSEIKVLGKYPDSDDDIKIMDGRYGPYVKYGRLNVTIPKTKSPEDLTLEEAVEMINNKQKNPTKKRTRGKSSAKK